MALEIWHNPRCSKSRQTLALVREQGLEPTIIEYLKTPPTVERLQQVLAMLALTPRQLMRSKETDYKAQGIDDDALTDDQLMASMIEFPKLIERPVVINGDQAAVGRPPEQVLEIL
ncbi:MAG: arsenate reductase (glutaredoxin) [Immundisolibacteraceae bacterium]|nr:arsenate reductase (glutaredoxin) [Immundisolibacteraceae bacterium]